MKAKSSSAIVLLASSLMVACSSPQNDLTKSELRNDLELAVQCQSSPTLVPAFFGSSVTGIKSENFDFKSLSLQKVIATTSDDITTENFRNLDKVPKGTISRNTLVRPLTEKLSAYSLNETDFSAENFKKLAQLLPVEILNPEQIYSRMKSVSEKRLFVQKGDVGLIWSSSLTPINQNYALIIETDYITFYGNSLKKGQYLVPKMTNETFPSSICQTQSGPVRVYEFDVYDRLNKISSVQIVPALDAFSLYPVQTKNIQTMMDVASHLNDLYMLNLTISDLEIDYKGFIRLPMTSEKNSSLVSGQAYDLSFVHYHGGDPVKSDTWGKPEMIKTLTSFTAAWQKKCQKENCLIQLGDIAFPTNAYNAIAFTKGENRDPLLHRTHSSGKCVDIRPFRKDGLIAPITHLQEDYDGSLSKEFLQFAETFGATKIYFNDQNAISGLKSASIMAGHDDHFHICF